MKIDFNSIIKIYIQSTKIKWATEHINRRKIFQLKSVQSLFGRKLMKCIKFVFRRSILRF
mgnify:CR=1 FL=1